MIPDTLIRKVLELSDVDVFECHGTIGLLPHARVRFMNPVPVQDGGHQRIGFAMIDPLRMEASAFLIKACPERLDLEGGVNYYFKTVVGDDDELCAIQLLRVTKGLHEVVSMGPML